MNAQNVVMILRLYDGSRQEVQKKHASELQVQHPLSR